MAVAAKGPRSARPETAAKHRKTTVAREPAPPRQPTAPEHNPAAHGIEAPRRPAAPAGPDPVLPLPPSDREKYAYVRRHSWVLTLCSALCFPVLVYSQVEMIKRYPWFWIYAPFVLLGVALFAVPLLTDGLSRGFDLAEHQQLVRSWLPLWYPSVDIFLPVCGEPVEVLRNTWTHVARLSRSYRGQVTTYVLDDSASPDLKAMAREFGFAYATRPDRGWLKKSGNLLYGYQISRGDFILLLDADFAPRHDLLNETLPYMTAYPRAGIVQTPQFFHVSDHQTWVERGAGAVQELFYRSIQTARARKGGATCVGSCAVYRRAALDENEGMSLSEHSEDLRTGFDLQRLGWQLHYLPIAVSTGTCPDNVLAFLNQQYRWCSGTITLMCEKLFWRTKLRVYTRLCYISGFVYYLYTALFTFVIPALAIAILIFEPRILQWRNMVFILPMIIYAGVVYPAWHRSPYRLEAWAVRVVSGWAHVFAAWDIARGKRRGWQPSGSSTTKQDGRRRFWIGVIGWSAGSAAVWVGLALWRLMTLDPYNVLLIFVLGVFELVIVSRILIQPRPGTAS
jgi:cellulose synthase (UDP-forming)